MNTRFALALVVLLSLPGISPGAIKPVEHDYLREAEQALRDHNDDAALKATDSALKANPDEASAHFWRGRVYAGKGDFEKALPDLDTAIKLQPNNADAFAHRGYVHQKLHSVDDALADFNQTIDLNPALAGGYANRADIKKRKGDWFGALNDWSRAIELDPNFALAHGGIAHLCGLIYEVREQTSKWIERGLAACDRATALAPDLPEILVARSRMSYAQKKYEESAMLAQRAIERKPDCDGAWNILGRAYFASGKFEEAAALTERALEANGDDYNTYIPYHQAQERLGHKKEGEAVRKRMTVILRQQLELVPEDVRARILLATQLANSSQDAEESIRHLQTAVALRPGDANTLYNAACTYGILGKKTEALDTLKKAVAAGYGNLNWAAKDSDLICLHDVPEFRALVGLGAASA